jgi:hypothetical protein
VVVVVVKVNEEDDNIDIDKTDLILDSVVGLPITCIRTISSSDHDK